MVGTREQGDGWAAAAKEMEELSRRRAGGEEGGRVVAGLERLRGRLEELVVELERAGVTEVGLEVGGWAVKFHRQRAGKEVRRDGVGAEEGVVGAGGGEGEAGEGEGGGAGAAGGAVRGAAGDGADVPQV